MRLSGKRGLFLFLHCLLNQQIFQPILAMDFELIKEDPISFTFSGICSNVQSLEIALFGDPTLPNKQDPDGNTLLHHLAIGGRLILTKEQIRHHSTTFYRFLEILLPYHPNILICNNNDLTPLHLAAACSHESVSEQILSYLLKYAIQTGINPNPSNKNGVTPLHLAAVNGSRKSDIPDYSVRYFLNLRNISDQTLLDIDVKTNVGETPLQWAIQSNGHRSFRGNANLLIKAGADRTWLDQCQSEDVSPIDLILEKLKGLFSPLILDKPI